MEKIYNVILCAFISTVFLSCNSSPLKYDKGDGVKLNGEFDQSVKITESTPTPVASPSPTQNTNTIELKPSAKSKNGKTKTASSAKSSEDLKSQEKSPKKKNQQSLAKTIDNVPAKVLSTKHEPELEDGAGFVGRRPIKDPFLVGETVVHEVSYFGVTAGHLTLKVEPFVNVNGRKSYTFATEIKTVGTFASFYTADDRAETLVDYETLVPSVFGLHVKESGQLREAKAHFDPQNLKATYWEHKYTKKDGDEEKKLQWDILEYSQNVFSAIFYMRAFQWELGKENSFRVADDGENIVFKAKAVRKEVLKTDVGEFPCIVVKPEITVKGAFRPVGDIYIWMTDDDRKLVLRIESKIKIGTLVTEAIKIERGTP